MLKKGHVVMIVFACWGDWRVVSSWWYIYGINIAKGVAAVE